MQNLAARVGDAAEIRFDQASRTSHSDQPVPLGGVPRAMREAAEMAGLDPCAELYNEALRYATEGHLRLARERLQMMLCMAPDDGEARLMLAKVHVAGQRWQESLAALDEAQAHGQPVPMNLRRAVEDHIRAEEASADEHRSALRAREQGEIKALRQEARRLRSENAMLLGRSTELERETRKWAWTTAGVSSLAILFIIANMFLGSGLSSSEAPQAEDAVFASTEPDGEAAANEVPATPADLANRAATALAAEPELDGTNLEVAVRGDAARLSGEVVSHKQLRSAEQTLMGAEGIRTVDIEGVSVLARTEGTTHTVAKGDTLSHIANSYYGDSTQAKRILRANRGTLKSAASLSIGQVLKIPSIQ